MTRQQYYWARSLARWYRRRVEVMVEQDTPTRDVRQAEQSLASVVARLPGGLTTPTTYTPNLKARRDALALMRRIERMKAARIARYYPSLQESAR